uniref:Cadherin domain-containing protein n=1 Tax=Romanomermis culicivorax TaxID=13658 RepID=A0A915KA35_ROMCU
MYVMIRKILIIFTAISVLTKASIKFSISKGNDVELKLYNLTQTLDFLESPVGTEVGRFDFAAKILTRTSYFRLDRSSGRLVTNRILDDFADEQLLILVEGKKPNFTVVDISVINNVKHEFAGTLVALRKLEIYENVPIGTKFTLNIADIYRKTSKFELFGDFSSHFLLDKELFLITNTLLDRETHSNYDLVIKSQKNDTINVKIQILDINDNYPRFVDQIFEKTIHFNGHLPKFTAIDSDIEENALISYSILKNSTDHIDIDSCTGQIFFKSVTNACLNCVCVFENCTKIINFRIFASDHGNPKLTSSVDCTIRFIDYPIISQKLPKIAFGIATPKRLMNSAYYQDKFYATFEENLPIGSFVIAVANFSTNFQHRITNGNSLEWFQIGEKNGIITTKKVIDYEIEEEIQLRVQLFDKSRALSSCTVYIKILNVDDNAPMFEKLVYNFTVMENLPPGSKIYSFKAFDVDSKPIIYSFSPKMDNISEDGYFFIDSLAGDLYTVKSFDFADVSVFSFDIFATSQKLFTYCHAKVFLTDTNNHRPKFSPREYFVNVKPTTKKIVRLEAYDLDTGDNGEIEYFILDDPSTNFRIDPYSGILYSTKKLQNFTKLIIGARDWGNLQALNNATVNIFVLDNPENQSPKFTRTNFIFNVKQTDLTLPNYVVGSVSATDAVKKSKIEYKIVDDHESFMIGRYSGEVRVKSPLNCILCGDINFSVAAIGEKGVGSANILINIRREPKSAVIFEKHRDEIEIDADFIMGIPFYYPKVKDQLTTFSIDKDDKKIGIDSNNGGLFFIGLTSSSNVTIFATSNNYTDSMILVIREIPKAVNKIHVDSDIYFDVPESIAVNTVLGKLYHRGAIFESECSQDSDSFGISADGTIFVKNQLDFEKNAHFILPFTVVFDRWKHFSTVHFSILNVNDNEPVCDDRTSVFHIFEEIPTNSYVGTFRATDLDSVVTYHIPKQMQSYFAIDSTIGRIITKSKFDYEILNQTIFETFVIIRDENFTVNCPLKIRILNSNDNRPTFVRNHYFLEIYENIALNSSILILQADDEDQDQLKFELDSKKFVIGRFSGEIFTNAQFDRELMDEYEIIAKVSDGRYVSDATISIRILDVNDNFPEFDTSATSSLNISKFASVGTHLHSFHATDRDIGLNSFIKYSILSGNDIDTFFLNPFDGNLILVKKLKFENYSLIIRAEDHGYPRLFKDVNFNINVLDQNSSRPKINFNSTLFMINLSFVPGVQVAQISGVGSFYKILYQAPSFNTFSILDEKMGRIYLNENLKFDFYNILLEVEHKGSKTTQVISFFVTRNQTKFDKSFFSTRNIAVLNSRTVQGGQRIESFNKTNLHIIGDDESGKLFEISTHGDLYIKRPSLIYKPIYRLTISNNRDSTFSFTVLLTNSKFSDIRFEKKTYEFTFDMANATEIGQVKVSQNTGSRNLYFSKFEYFLTDIRSTNDNLPMNYFSVDNDGKIRTTSNFWNDLEDIDQAMLKILAIDVLATEPQTAECLVSCFSEKT